MRSLVLVSATLIEAFNCVPLALDILYYLLLTAICLIPGGSVYKDHTFNKETAHTSQKNSTIHVHEHSQ
jgi:hypothetical protein